MPTPLATLMKLERERAGLLLFLPSAPAPALAESGNRNLCAISSLEHSGKRSGWLHNRIKDRRSHFDELFFRESGCGRKKEKTCSRGSRLGSEALRCRHCTSRKDMFARGDVKLNV